MKRVNYQNQFEDAFTQQTQNREKQIQDQMSELSALKTQPKSFADVDLSMLLKLGDDLGKTNYSSAYKAPSSADDRKLMMQKLQDSINKQQQGLSNDQLQFLKQKADEQAALARENRMMAKMNQPTTGSSKDESMLRKEFLGHPVIKSFKDIDGAAKAAINNDASTGPAQQALVFQFSKILDPQSVVRETEYAMSAANAGEINQARQLLTKMQTGQMLTNDQVSMMKNVVKNLYGSYRKTYDNTKKTYGDLAKRKNIMAENVTIDPYIDVGVEQSNEALDWAMANPNDPRAQRILELEGK